MTKRILEHDDDIEVSILFSNKTPDDILLKKELDTLAEKYPKRFRLWYTISRPPKPGQKWEYAVGHVNGNMISQTLFFPTTESVVFVCGPPPMIEMSCLPYLRKLGYTKSNAIEL